jgi:hypothetical protein
MPSVNHSIRGFVRHGFLITGLPFALASAGLHAAEPQAPSQALRTDRWMEIDLYWFDRSNKQASAEAFWERNHPLYEHCEGWKGVTINIGWLMGVVTDWSGDLDQPITLPKEMKIEPYYRDHGHLLGSTTERMELQKRRFELAEKQESLHYESWTYRDVKELAEILRRVAKERHQIPDFKVGTMIVAWQSIYGGEPLAFGKRHPQLWWAYPFAAELSDDKTRYGAYPDGITKGTPMTEFFGRQWGELSKKVGLDSLLLRDGTLGMDIYPRLQTHQPDQASLESWGKRAAAQGKAAADLIRHTKQGNPQAVVMWYSDYNHGMPAVSTWRIRNIDLEAIAKEGFLDVWIDQSWAVAWNEAGARHHPNFWNFPQWGYTYFLANILGHAAALSETRVRHYIIPETVDAWETQDAIHTAPSRLKWCYWAFTHAAVKTPDGLKLPAGNYISWAHKKKDLLSKENVNFVVTNLNEAVADAQETKEVGGPTLIYCRSALEWQQKNKPAETMGEWIEDHAGSVMKWSMPIMSIARLEHLDAITTDLPVFQTPNHLSERDQSSVIRYLKSGKPSMVIANPALGIDPEIAAVIGIRTDSRRVEDLRYIATTSYRTEGIFKDIPNTFPIFQPFTKNIRTEGETIYQVHGQSPCLTHNHTGGKQIIFWDAPEMAVDIPGGQAATGLSLDQFLGSPTPFALTARLLNQVSRDSGLTWVDEIRQYEPVSLHLWQRKDGSHRMLIGNLEEGINHGADQSRSITVNLSGKLTASDLIRFQDLWAGSSAISQQRRLPVVLGPGETKLIGFPGESAK